MAFDHETEEVLLDFTEDFGMLAVLDLKQAKIVRTTKPSDPFFTGFENFVFSQAFLGNSVKGISSSSSSLLCFARVLMAALGIAVWDCGDRVGWHGDAERLLQRRMLPICRPGD